MGLKSMKIDGQNILYHYLQKVLLEEENALSRELITHLLIDLSIWIPPNLYRRLPIILPYVLRDPSCRRNKQTGEDEWGTPNENGFLRDDNSVIKGIVRSFRIRSPRVASYNDLRLGTGFVASHIWGKVEFEGDSLFSSRHYLLNSFVPNLVWLPVQISKLTDREGSFAQRLLQAISHNIYGDVNMPEEISRLWKYLPFPEELRTATIDLTRTSHFVVPEEWIRKRTHSLLSEIEAILLIDRDDSGPQIKVKSRRYLRALSHIPAEKRRELNEWLARYRNLIKPHP